MKCPLTPSLHFSQPVLGPKNTRLLGSDGIWEKEVAGEDNTIAFGLELGGVDGRVGGCCSSFSCLFGGTLNMIGVCGTILTTACVLSRYRLSWKGYKGI